MGPNSISPRQRGFASAEDRSAPYHAHCGRRTVQDRTVVSNMADGRAIGRLPEARGRHYLDQGTIRFQQSIYSGGSHPDITTDCRSEDVTIDDRAGLPHPGPVDCGQWL